MKKGFTQELPPCPKCGSEKYRNYMDPYDLDFAIQCKKCRFITSGHLSQNNAEREWILLNEQKGVLRRDDMYTGVWSPIRVMSRDIKEIQKLLEKSGNCHKILKDKMAEAYSVIADLEYIALMETFLPCVKCGARGQSLGLWIDGHTGKYFVECDKCGAKGELDKDSLNAGTNWDLGKLQRGKNEHA